MKDQRVRLLSGLSFLNEQMEKIHILKQTGALVKYTKFWRFQEVRKKIELLVLLLALAGIYTVSRNLEKYVQSDQVKR